MNWKRVEPQPVLYQIVDEEHLLCINSERANENVVFDMEDKATAKSVLGKKYRLVMYVEEMVE